MCSCKEVSSTGNRSQKIADVENEDEPLHTFDSRRGYVDVEPQSCFRCLHNRSFDMDRPVATDDIPISAWKLALNDESQPLSGEGAAAANKEAPVDHESCHMKYRREENEDVIESELKCAVKALVANEMETKFEELLDVLRKRSITREEASDLWYKTSLSKQCWTCFVKASLQRR